VGRDAAIRWGDINGNSSTDLVDADVTIEPRSQAVDSDAVVSRVSGQI
jgi:hypothetical protein